MVSTQQRYDYSYLARVLRMVLATWDEAGIQRAMTHRGVEQVLRQLDGKTITDQHAFDFVVGEHAADHASVATV